MEYHQFDFQVSALSKMNRFAVVVCLLAASFVGSNAQCASLGAVERDLIRQSWDVAKRSGNIAPDTFIRLFSDHPEYHKLFSKFATVPVSELRTNGDFLSQAYTVVAGLNAIIESLGSDNLLAQQLTHIGVSHVPRAVQAWHFDEFARALVATLKAELGAALTPQIEDAWIEGLNNMNKVVVKYLRDSYDVPNPDTKLTPRQKKTVAGSWARVRDSRQQIGSEAFLRLFKEHPAYQQLFPRFAAVDAAALASDAEFQKQVKAVVDRLDVAINSLDNDLVLVGQLIYLGHTHFPRKVNREHFVYFGRDLIQVLGEKGVTAEERATWSQVLLILAESIVDNLN